MGFDLKSYDSDLRGTMSHSYVGWSNNFALPESSGPGKYNVFRRGGRSTEMGNIATMRRGGNRGYLDAERAVRIRVAVYNSLDGESENAYQSKHYPHTQVFSSILGNNLNSSYVVKQCQKTDGAFDTVLWSILKKKAGAIVNTSFSTPGASIFKSLAGWDPYLQTRFNSSKLEDDSLINRQFLPDLTMFENGIMGAAFEENECYVEKCKVQYTSDTGDTVETSSIRKTINEAFGSVDGSISFGDYESIANNLSSACKDFGKAMGKMHRSGKYQNLNKAEQNAPMNKGIFKNYPQTAFDPGSVFSACLETFKERFAENFEEYYLWYGFQLDPTIPDASTSWPRGMHATSTEDMWRIFSQPDPHHIKRFASLMAYGIINSDDQVGNNNARCFGLAIAKQIAGAFVGDFYKGHLTFSNETEEVVEFETVTSTDSEGNPTTSVQETKFMAKVNANPLTGAPASLRGSSSGVWGVLVPPKDLVASDGSIMKNVADMNVDTDKATVSSDYLAIYQRSAHGNGFIADNAFAGESLGGTNFSDMQLSGWMQWAPWFNPEADNIYGGGAHFFTKQFCSLRSAGGGGQAYLKDKFDELLESSYQEAEISWGADTLHASGKTFTPKDSLFEACNMWKYSWHWAKDYHEESDVPYIPLLANLWAAEMIEMCLLTFRKILKTRGHNIGPASPADLCFPFEANTAPYTDSGGYADIIMDNLERVGETDCEDFPAGECFWQAEAHDQDYSTGIGFRYWVPTMRSIHENFCNDDGTLAATGKPLAEIFGHIIDNMAMIMKQTYPFFHVAYIQWEGVGTSNAYTRFPILGNYHNMVDGDAVASGETREKVGAPVYPRMLYPYYNSHHDDALDNDKLLKYTDHLVEQWIEMNLRQNDDTATHLAVDMQNVTTSWYGMEQTDSNMIGEGVGTAISGERSRTGAAIRSNFVGEEVIWNRVTFPEILEADDIIYWDSTSNHDDQDISLIDFSVLFALTGNTSLDSFADSEVNDLTDFTGRARWIKGGYYNSDDENVDAWGDSPSSGDTGMTPRAFWVPWYIAAIPTIIEKLLELEITPADTGALYYTSSDSVLQRMMGGLVENSSGIYSFGDDGILLGVAPMLSLTGYTPYLNSEGSSSPTGYAGVGGLGQTGNGGDARFGGTVTNGHLRYINNYINKLWRGLILSCREPYFKAIAFNLFDKFGERIEDYSGTAIKAFNRDGDAKNLEPVVEYISDLIESGEAGADILQNLTDQQMALKYLSFYRQKGDSSSGLIPAQETIDSKLMAAINLMFDTRDMSKEGLRTLCFGIPATGVEEFDDSSSASNTLGGSRYIPQNMWIGITGYNFEYPQVSLEPICIPFNANLFVVTESFEDLTIEDILSYGSISDIRNNMKFLKAELSVQEGEGESTQIIVNDDVRIATLSDLYGDDLNDRILVSAYHILRSYLLENYYRIVLGVSINEDTFPSTSEELGLGINDYASNFAEALSSEFSSYNSGVSSAVSQVMSSLSTSVSNYNTIASGFSTTLGATRFEDLSDEILDSATNAVGSRLYTAESMRQQIIGAKRFDRVIFFPFHPDDFCVRWENSVGTTAGSPAWDDMVPYTTGDDVRELIGYRFTGETETAVTLDDEGWILTTGVEEAADGDDTVQESDYNNLYDNMLFSYSGLVEYSSWGTVIDTGIKFKARDGENSINFFRASVIIYDGNTLGDDA